MDRHIPQPPHSAGLPFKGLRSRIDPRQIPSPIDVAEEDQALWSTRSYMTCTSDQHVPLSGSEYHGIDQGNSTPRFIRLTTYTMPDSANLADTCEVPLAAIIQPFAEQQPEEDAVPVVQCGPLGPPRCSQPWCRAYINPWCMFLSEGGKWRCNLCNAETEVSSDYYSPLGPDLRRLDSIQRPELSRGTVDFLVPEEYWARQPDARLIPSFQTPFPHSPTSRQPQPMRYVFVIDVSVAAVKSGLVESACMGLLNILYCSTSENEDNDSSSCFPATSQLAIITFDQTLHFYNLSLSKERASLHIVPDIEEVFVPLRDEMFAFPQESRHILESLLLSIPRRFSESQTHGTALGSALRAALASLHGRGGQVVGFQAGFPITGVGGLTPLEEDESVLHGTEKEKTLFLPRNESWRELGEECAEEGVGVSLFLAANQPIAIASIGIVSSLTGGEIFFHPRYNRPQDEKVLFSQLRHFISRETAYNCTMRVRCSKGLRVSRHLGNFHQRSATDLNLGTCDADKAIVAILEHSGIQLDERADAYIQSAVLYTTPSGSRRVRTCNIMVPISGMAGNIFRFADHEAVVAVWAKQAIDSMVSRSLRSIRDGLTEKCAALLLAYRRNCAASAAPSQLILPEQFKLLPLYTLTILKCRAIKGRNVISDVRNFYAHRILSFGVAAMIRHLYPPLLALHDLTDDAGLPDSSTGRIQLPTLMRSSYLWMESNGLYFVDNGELMILWIGASISSQLLKDLLDVETVHEINISDSQLPSLPTRLSSQFRNILAHRRRERGRRLKVMFARQNLDAAEIDFSDMLVEDQNNDAMSYVDYLCYVHKQINIAVRAGARNASS